MVEILDKKWSNLSFKTSNQIPDLCLFSLLKFLIKNCMLM